MRFRSWQSRPIPPQKVIDEIILSLSNESQQTVQSINEVTDMIVNQKAKLDEDQSEIRGCGGGDPVHWQRNENSAGAGRCVRQGRRACRQPDDKSLP